MSRCAQGTPLTKRLQELRRGDAAGLAAADVLHVGGVAVDHACRRRRQRHAPQFLADRLARGDELLRPARRCCETARHSSLPSATMIAPVRVARSIMNCGLKRSWQYHSASASTSRPSASVLSTSMVWPDIEVTMSPGRCAVAVRHVLDQADDADRVDLGLAPGQRLHQADDHARRRPCPISCPPCRRPA